MAEGLEMRVFRKRMANGKLSPTYYFDVVVDGRRISRSTGCRKKREAEAWAGKYVDELRREKSAKGVVEKFRDVLAGGEQISLDDSFGAFVKTPKKQKPGARHLRILRSRWEDFLGFLREEFPGVNTINQVKPAHARKYIEQVEAVGHLGKWKKQLEWAAKSGEPREPKPPAAKTLNDYRNTCQYILATLAPAAGLTENAFDGIPLRQKDTAARRPYTPEELQRIAGAADPFCKALFVVGVNTGLRLGDICRLKWSDVDLAGGWITTNTSKRKKVVDIPIMPALAAFLQELPRDSEYVLPAHAEMYRENETGLSWRVRKLLATVEISGTQKVEGRARAVPLTGAHAMRNTFIWIAIENGVPLHVIQAIVGHATLQQTLEYLRQVNREEAKRHFEQIPDYLGITAAAPLSLEEQLLQILDGGQADPEKLARIRDLVERRLPDAASDDRRRLR